MGTVSTHGTNDYTFLEYVNLRLVAIYDEDTDNTDGTGETTSNEIRTSALKQAQYVQVTFTMGEKYAVKSTEDLIPSDSVRVYKGTFADDSAMEHACEAWSALENIPETSEFETWLAQPCAPAATMCQSPTSVPDNFVSFNIPLGISEPTQVNDDDLRRTLTTSLGDYFGEGVGASNDLSNNIFVHMVIAAEDTTCTDPSSGSCVMRTTLSASIPIVQGGINIFCDGIAAKTDLREVADVDIVVGTAKDSSELSNLEIKVDVTDSVLNPETERTQIDSDSIEAGVMTLVIKGKDEYFLNNAGRYNVKVELEDVIPIHIMSPGGTTLVADDVEALITQARDDNTDTNGLDTDGYALNGAFNMVIDRSALRAHLEPSTSLLNLCPFNPVRPTDNVVLTETCVTRRDGRYRRAYMINPGYEWTPTQTGGASIFSVSQKLFMFALITLDEGIATSPGNAEPTSSYPTIRRRMLLSSVDDALKDGQSGLGGASLEFNTSPTTMLATAFNVPRDTEGHGQRRRQCTRDRPDPHHEGQQGWHFMPSQPPRSQDGVLRCHC